MIHRRIMAIEQMQSLAERAPENRDAD